MPIIEQLNKLALGEAPSDPSTITAYVHLYEATFREWLEKPSSERSANVIATRRLLTDGPVRMMICLNFHSSDLITGHHPEDSFRPPEPFRQDLYPCHVPANKGCEGSHEGGEFHCCGLGTTSPRHSKNYPGKKSRTRGLTLSTCKIQHRLCGAGFSHDPAASDLVGRGITCTQTKQKGPEGAQW